jgi:hypothetical protein
MDSFSIFVNSKNVMAKASYNEFLRNIEQVMTYQLNGQFKNSRQKN